jgi:hypothetical protein
LGQARLRAGFFILFLVLSFCHFLRRPLLPDFWPHVGIVESQVAVMVSVNAKLTDYSGQVSDSIKTE